MKKNGFIATSLIYSFFLIFITLFLTIVADYLQNKVSLNVIEKSIKDEINDSIGIKDFEVGDILSQSSIITGDNDIWIISRIEFNNTNSNMSAIYLYSYEIKNSVIETENIKKLSIDYIEEDLKYNGIYNNTFLNKLLYIFNGDYFNLSDYKVTKNLNCLNIDSNNTLINSCEVNTEDKYRIRKKVIVGNNRYFKTLSPDGSMTITGVK